MASSLTFGWRVASFSSFSTLFSCLEGAILILLVPAPLQICARIDPRPGRILSINKMLCPVCFGDGLNSLAVGAMRVDLHKPHDARQLSGVLNPASEA
jgi:hypothetical protein